jgi:uncharacterized membrane protein YccC
MFHVREILLSASVTHLEEQPTHAKARESAVAAIRRIDRLAIDAERLGRTDDVCDYLQALDGSLEGADPALSPAIKTALPPHSLEILDRSWTLCR